MEKTEEKKLKRLQEINRTAQINHVVNKDYRSTKTMTNKEFENLWTKKELELETLQKQRRILTEKTNRIEEPEWLPPSLQKIIKEIDKLDSKIRIIQEDLYSDLGPDIEKKARDIKIELTKTLKQTWQYKDKIEKNSLKKIVNTRRIKNLQKKRDKAYERLNRLHLHPLRITRLEWENEAKKIVHTKDQSFHEAGQELMRRQQNAAAAYEIKK